MNLKEGQVLVHGDGFIKPETEKELCKFAENEDLIHYVCMSMRHGVEEFTTKLEFTHYKPGTSRNDLLSLRTLVWNGLLWFVISVPYTEKHFTEKILPLYGLRTADGVPMMIGSGRTQFPITGANVFTLENVSGHPTYRNDSDINQAMRIAERQSAEDIRSGKEKKVS
ncbi:MAG: hypothetical protein U9Q91_03975 [Candidatus Marinimicrobia bacterium]|nr:hypothetical protein [Candidatus Neomarinimicrobiota bacterium]